MISLYSDNSEKFCDGFTRRGFLRVGGLSLGGATLPQILSAESNSLNKGSLGHKAVIMIFLAGGPPHQDMWDIKKDAPSNIRGEFNSIKTNVSGIEICELFPKIAHHFLKLRGEGVTEEQVVLWRICWNVWHQIFRLQCRIGLCRKRARLCQIGIGLGSNVSGSYG